MPCDPLIADPFTFPLQPSNRPGLPRIAYRIGRYAEFVEVMKRNIDAAPELAGWTHRLPDDPGIALLEGAGIVADILSFYQELYANEAYLRTAAWRESVAELVRLTGYRLSPGIGGRATLAFEARGATPVIIREGFPVKAELADQPTPAELQTDAELLAWPHLGRFHLYRPRRYAGTIAAGARSIELYQVDGADDSAALAAFELKAGERLMLVPSEDTWTRPGTPLSTQPLPQAMTVTRVTRTLDRVALGLDTTLVLSWASPARAWRLGRTFRHFGHNAPPSLIEPVTGTDGTTITGSKISDTHFERIFQFAPTVGDLSDPLPYTPLGRTELALDQEINDFAVGGTVIVQGTIHFDDKPAPTPFIVTRTVVGSRAGPLQWGNISGPSTILTLDGELVLNPAITGAAGDIRDLRIHEVKSPPLLLRPVSDPLNDAFSSGTSVLRYYGTATQAQAVAGRRLYFSHPDGRALELTCTNVATDFPTPTPPDLPRRWSLSFDRPPDPFTHADFDETVPTVTVFGNLLDASQGKQEREAVLGNGDNRQSFQTFVLPKAPLTYFLAAGAIPPHTPELEIWVAGRLWSRVDAFFGRGPRDEIYIVREDAESRSFVQFGDGETGARLPSGVKNVSAIYRSGVGARGPIKPGATPSAAERPIGFDKVSLAGIVSGGADPEDLDKARVAAPGKVQSLGRLVSIQDYETETLSVPGVVTAVAAWDLHHGVPAVILRVLLEAGREAEFAEVRATIDHAQRCSGPDRFPLVVEQARLRYIFVDLNYARDPSYRQEDVEAALRAALGLAGDAAHQRTGLFGLHARRLGESEYSSRIEARVQNVAGVLWCQVCALGRFPSGATDKATLILPAAPRPLLATLPCSPHELLQLWDVHLTLTSVAEPTAGVCA
jgi:hypothetical protein